MTVHKRTNNTIKNRAAPKYRSIWNVVDNMVDRALLHDQLCRAARLKILSKTLADTRD